VRTDSNDRRLTPEATDMVQEFVRLNRRRLRRNPPLTGLEHQRWLDLRWRIEDLLEGPHTKREGPPRKALRVPSNYEAEVASPLHEEISRVCEIGEGGLFLATERPLAVATPLHLKLLGAAGDGLEVEGAIVWIRPPGKGPEPAGVGLRFAGLDGVQREALANLVEAALAAL
jgi:Tfp pilus assembly protein PilZ